MKASSSFKKEFNQDYADFSYGFRKIGSKIMLWILVLSLISGVCGLGYKYLKTNADREIFKQSVTYNEGMLDDLAQYKFEYDSATDDVEREAIASLVRNRFANFDQDKIENIELQYFLKECGL